MNVRKSMLSATILLSVGFAFPKSANAWAFYWSKVEVKTSSWKTCMSFANDQVRRANLTQIKQSNLDVSGVSNGNLATITCIGTGGNSKAMAVIMVVGDVDAPVRQLRDKLVTGIQGEQIIDNGQ